MRASVSESPDRHHSNAACGEESQSATDDGIRAHGGRPRDGIPQLGSDVDRLRDASWAPLSAPRHIPYLNDVDPRHDGTLRSGRPWPRAHGGPVQDVQASLDPRDRAHTEAYRALGNRTAYDEG